MVDFFGVLSSASDAALMIVLIVMTCSILGVMAWLIIQAKRYNIFVTIYEHDAFKNLVGKQTKGGVFVDRKTNTKRFWIKKLKSFSLDPEKVRLVPEKRGRKMFYKAYLYKFSDTDIRPVEWNISPNPGMTATITEEDANWLNSALIKWEATIFSNKLLQYLPLAIMIFSLILVFIIAIMLIKKFDVILPASENLKMAAESIARAQTGSGVIT